MGNLDFSILLVLLCFNLIARMNQGLIKVIIRYSGVPEIKHYSYRNSQAVDKKWCVTREKWELEAFGHMDIHVHPQIGTADSSSGSLAQQAVAHHLVACRNGNYLGNFWDLLEMSNRS